MPFYRLTALFEFAGPPPAGFSESWDFLAVDDTTAVNQALSFPKERCSLLSVDWSLDALRLSRISIKASDTCKLLYTPVNVPVCIQPQKGLVDCDADTPWAALLVTIATKQADPSVPDPPRARQWQLRGICDDWWKQVKLDRPQPAGKIAKFVTYLKDQLGAGHVKGNAGCLQLGIQPYTAPCLKRVSSRRIGRPFGLLRGAQSRRTTPS